MAVRRVRREEPESTARSAPRSSAYKDDDEDYYEEPAPRRRAREDDEEPAPRRRAAARDDDDEPAPRRRAVARDDDEDEPPRRRPRAVDDEDEDDPPPRRRRAAEDEPAPAKRPPMKTGWSGAKEVRQGDWAPTVDFTEDDEVYLFIDDEPFVSFKQHWIERKGKKSWLCPASLEVENAKCPLCDILGDKPRGLSAFNVVHLEPDGRGGTKATLQVLTAGPRLTGKLEALAKKRDGLTQDYYAMSKSGGKGTYDTSVVPIKLRDLEEDYEVSPLTDDEIARFEAKAYTADNYPENIPTQKDLKEIAAEAV